MYTRVQLTDDSAAKLGKYAESAVIIVTESLDYGLTIFEYYFIWEFQIFHFSSYRCAFNQFTAEDAAFAEGFIETFWMLLRIKLE